MINERRAIIAAQLRESADRFCVSLRMGDGIDAAALEALKKSIVEAGEEWRSEMELPKPLVHDIVGLYSAVQGSSNVYDEEYANRVRAVARELETMIFRYVVPE